MTTALRADARANRERILDAARLELNRDPDASLETIASAAGLSRRAVYGHFATRDELLQVLLERGVARVRAAFIDDPHDDPLVDLCLIAVTLWREVEATRVMTLFAVRGPYKQQTVEALAPVRMRALADVRRGQRDGSIRDDIDAVTLTHLLEEGILTVLDEATTESLDAELVHALVQRIVLGLLGLDWRSANDIIATTPHLSWKTA